jgi:2-hydroxychromene-2-carboxylate isomerase
MLTLNNVQREALESVEQVLHAEFLSGLSRTQRRDSHEAIAEVFNNLDRQAEKRLMGALERTNEAAAAKIKELMFTFEDLTNLGPRRSRRCSGSSTRRSSHGRSRERTSGPREVFTANMSTRGAKLFTGRSRGARPDAHEGRRPGPGRHHPGCEGAGGERRNHDRAQPRRRIRIGVRTRRVADPTAGLGGRDDMSRPVLEFWYEFASTYSYLSGMRIEREAEKAGVDISWRPFLLGPIFAAQGWTTSPFNLYPAKGRYMWRDMEREAAALGLPCRRPVQFPQNSLLAARVALLGAAHSWGPAFTKGVFTAEFGEGRSISDPDLIADVLRSSGSIRTPCWRRRRPEENKAG